jgi:hypothetical protein
MEHKWRQTEEGREAGWQGRERVRQSSAKCVCCTPAAPVRACVRLCRHQLCFSQPGEAVFVVCGCWRFLRRSLCGCIR